MDILPPTSGFLPSPTRDWLARDRRRELAVRRRDAESASRAWIPGGVVGLFLLVASVGAVAWLTAMSNGHSHGGFARARYRFRFVDTAGLPVAGVSLHVEGPVRPARERMVDRDGGQWPIHEAGQRGLRTDARGELTVHQPERHAYQWTVFEATLFSRARERPRFACVFKKSGYRPHRIRFTRLDELARWRIPGAPMHAGPGGFDYPTIAVDVVLQAKQRGQ